MCRSCLEKRVSADFARVQFSSCRDAFSLCRCISFLQSVRWRFALSEISHSNFWSPVTRRCIIRRLDTKYPTVKKLYNLEWQYQSHSEITKNTTKSAKHKRILRYILLVSMSNLAWLGFELRWNCQTRAAVGLICAQNVEPEQIQGCLFQAVSTRDRLGTTFVQTVMTRDCVGHAR